jgi:hypothetical protein
MKMTFQEIRIIDTGLCIANQLRDVNTISMRSWYIATYIRKIYDFKIEVVPFIINISTDLTTVVWVTQRASYQKQELLSGCECPLRVPHKNNARFVFTSSYLEVRMSCLRYLCLVVNSGVQHILCCVFVLLWSCCVPYIASFSRLYMCYCPFGVL